MYLYSVTAAQLFLMFYMISVVQHNIRAMYQPVRSLSRIFIGVNLETITPIILVTILGSTWRGAGNAMENYREHSRSPVRGLSQIPSEYKATALLGLSRTL
jgi:hypothetical protein